MVKLLNKLNTALLIIDIQEKIINVMNDKETIIKNNRILLNGCKVLNIPVYYTEQYPKGLGSTIIELKDQFDGSEKYSEKDTFSAVNNTSLIENFRNNGIENIIIAGIESHICVLQTAFHLQENNFEVFLAADATGSRKLFDYTLALQRMSLKGVNILSTESILFEMLEKSGTPEFKKISELIR